MAFGINIIKSLFQILLITILSGFGLNAQLNSGAPAADFSLTDVHNNSYNLYAKMGTNKSAVVEFGVTWCHYCWDFHQSHVMRDIYNNYSSETTAIFMEADYATNTECLFGPANCNYLTQGDFVTGMPYTIANLSPTNGANVIADYNVIYYPLLYTISPDKRVWELKAQTYLEVENWIRHSFKLNATAALTHCFCGFNGKINLNTIGGYGNLKFNWSNGQTSRNIENLGPGTYYVTITDDNGYFKNFGPWIINVPPKLLEIYSNKLNHVKCYGESTGSIEIQARYGVGPYSYNWSNGNTNSKIDQLNAGPYKVTVTDHVGCSTTGFYVINQSTDINLSGLSSADLCETASGSIQLFAQGGTPTYKFDIGNGFQNIALFQNIIGGKEYYVLLQDANNCRDSLKLFVPKTVKPILNISGDSILNCKIMNSQLQSKGLPRTVKYTWTNSDDSSFLSKDSFILVTKSGHFILSVKDTISSCTNEDSFRVITDQLLPTIAIQKPDSLSCFKSQTNLDASLSSHGPNFINQWSSSNGQIISASDSLVIRVSKAGNYQLKIENILNYCTNQAEIELLEITKPTAAFQFSTDDQDIAFMNSSIGIPDQYFWDFGDGQQSNEANPKHRYQNYGEFKICLKVENECGSDTKCISVLLYKPGILAIASTEINHVLCYGQATGTIQILLEGGQPPYRILWSNQDSTSNIKQLNAGKYQVVVTDQLNNTLEKEYTILQPNEITLEQADINAASSGQANGSIFLQNLGGIKPYQYNWSNGMSSNPIDQLKAGSYSVQLTDANVCVKEFGPFVVKELTAVKEELGFPFLRFTPNPIEKTIHLQIESNSNLTISITDLFGCVRFTKHYMENRIQEKLEIQYIPAGIYFFAVQAGSHQKIIKFLWY